MFFCIFQGSSKKKKYYCRLSLETWTYQVQVSICASANYLFHHHAFAQPSVDMLYSSAIWPCLNKNLLATCFEQLGQLRYGFSYVWWIDSDIYVHTCIPKDIRKERDPYKMEAFILCLSFSFNISKWTSPERRQHCLVLGW